MEMKGKSYFEFSIFHFPYINIYQKGKLVLEDGRTFRGASFGADGKPSARWFLTLR